MEFCPKKSQHQKASVRSKQRAAAGIATANDETKIAHSLFSKLLLILILKSLSL